MGDGCLSHAWHIECISKTLMHQINPEPPQLKLLIRSKWQRGALFLVSGLCIGHYMFKNLSPENKVAALFLGSATGLPLLVRIPKEETKTKPSTDEIQ